MVETPRIRGGKALDVSEEAFQPPKLYQETLQKNLQNYAKKVAQRYDELVKQGWAFAIYRDMDVAEASRVAF
jgi:hypothetical protein